MGRPRGSRNADYEHKRRDLARRAVRVLVREPSTRASLRELARATEVSVSTLRHYFDDREGIVEAALAEMGESAQRFLDEAVASATGSAEDRLISYLLGLTQAWTRYRVGRAHAVGFAEGSYSSSGPAYVDSLLEPFVEATERVLIAMDDEGIASFEPPRSAALALLGPLLLVLNHQETLGGAGQHPLDMDGFLRTHVGHFIQGWARATRNAAIGS